ncbi:MAG: DUF4244 domain-containing protein [Actinomycetota bacterium]
MTESLPKRWGAGWSRFVRRVSALMCAGEGGQSTTEYTLVILVAATIALLLLNWAKGGAIVNFFQTIFDKVVGMFS